MTFIGIISTNLQSVATELVKVLADETVLYIKAKNAHWNIEGAYFITGLMETHEKMAWFLRAHVKN